MINPSQQEIERKYASASRAVDRVRSIISGDQDKERDDAVIPFLGAVYSVLEYVRVACTKYDKSHGDKSAGATVWCKSQMQRPFLVLFRKIRDVDEHLFVARILHRMNLSLPASAAISAPISWRRVRQNGINIGRTLADVFWDPRIAWLRKIVIAARPYQTPLLSTEGPYSWGFSAASHNALAPKQHRLTPTEMAVMDASTGADLFAQILVEVRGFVDEAKQNGFG